MSSSQTGLSGIVLAGGESRRMGVDKAGLRIGGRSLVARVVAVLEPMCREVLVVARPGAFEERPALAALEGVRPIEDRYGAGTPLCGLEAGLAAATCEWTVVVGCDMPLLSRELLEHQAALARHTQAVVLVDVAGVQPLHSLYHRSALPVARRRIERGEHALRGLLCDLDVTAVGEVDARRFDPHGTSATSANSPEDLVKIERWLRLGSA